MEDILEKYLKEVIKNSHHCQHCTFYHSDGDNCFCYFAYACIKKDFYFQKEED